MKLNKLTTILITTMLFVARAHGEETTSAATTITETKVKNTCSQNEASKSNKYEVTHWYRNSAEKKAQYHQVFNIALETLALNINQKKLKPKEWGIIMDIDETVLDNSEYEKEIILSCKNYDPESYYTFIEKKRSTATPGADDFTCHVQKLGGQVVLVTNRNGHYDDNIQNATVENLISAGICFDNVVFANGDKDKNKNQRFKAVEKGKYDGITAIHSIQGFKVLAYFGDNIQDFPNITQKEAIKQDKNAHYWEKFGKEYFSLPNPIYGSWEHNEFN